MPKWTRPSEGLPEVYCGDRVAIIVMERLRSKDKNLTPRLVILIATETGWDAIEEVYQGYSIHDGVCWSLEKDICEIANHILSGD